jgi:hypothetical protein
MITFKEFKFPPKVEKLHVYELDENQLKELDTVSQKMSKIVEDGGIPALEEAINEGVFGAVAGFLIGPAIGKVIAKALGIEKGILYDMFTSRLVSAALGSAIQNNLGK